jgi:hypothetical protein
MTPKPLTGTYFLDGLIEGPLGSAPDAQAKLADWMQIAKQAGYNFSIEIEGSGFNLLGDNTPQHAPSPTTDMAEPLRDLLQQLAQSFPLELRSGLFSTVRSVQYGENLETQTIYALSPDGAVDAQQRTVDAVTAMPEPPLTGKDHIRVGLISLVALIAIFGISSLFVDWGDMFTKTLRKVTPVDVESIAIELGSFEPYFEVTEKDTKGNKLQLALKRKAGYPKDLAAIEKLLGSAKGLAERKTLEALASGYVRIEVFGAEDKYQGTAVLRIADLASEDDVKTTLAFLREDPPTRLRFIW